MATDEQVLLEKWRTLPPDKQQEMLDFAEFLQQKTLGKEPRKSLLGMAADLNVNISEEEMAQARREIWSTFPRTLEE